MVSDLIAVKPDTKHLSIFFSEFLTNIQFIFSNAMIRLLKDTKERSSMQMSVLPNALLIEFCLILN